MTRRSFGRVLDGIVSVVLASAVGSLGGYGCAAEEPPKDAEGNVLPAAFEDEASFTCTTPLSDVVSNLKPAVPVDYVEVRRQTFDSYAKADAGPPEIRLATRSSKGTPCSTATNNTACRAALTAAKVEEKTEVSGWAPFTGGGNVQPATYDRDFVVYTRGDEVGVARSMSELVKFLGPIDTLEEARLVLATQSREYTCVSKPRKSGARENADGSFEILVSGQSCGGPFRTRLRVATNGEVTTVASEDLGNQSVCGRRPEGLARGDFDGASRGLGPYFAEVAYLEAASVVAFRRLELELGRFGAPQQLILRARRSRADEIRHARITARLARRFGAEVRALEIEPMTSRELLAIAIENAAEGCIRETYGAVVAAFQARTAEDPEVRSVLSRIARDEARHAELSHDVAIWLDTQLDEAARARVAEARVRAFAELEASLDRAPSEEVVHVAGMPSTREAHALLQGLAREIFGADLAA